MENAKVYNKKKAKASIIDIRVSLVNLFTNLGLKVHIEMRTRTLFSETGLSMDRCGEVRNGVR